MTKLAPIAAAVGLALVLGLVVSVAACSTEVTTTTTTAGRATVTTTMHTLVTEASTTSTTQAMEVWQTARYDQATPGLVYSGRWIRSSVGPASAGSFVYTDSPGASLTFHFMGSYCGWMAKTSDQYGKATVTLDGGAPSTVDLYSKKPVWRHIVWETKSLPFGDHTLKIQWTGKKKAVSKGTLINVDAIEIVGALVGLYQQNNAHFKYAGKWKTPKDLAASGGDYALTKWSKASLTVSFTGLQVVWLAKKGAALGIAQVVVDDGAPVSVDLYSSDAQWIQSVWNSGRLPMGPHVVKIRWTGKKNEQATDTYIDVDAFEITGAIQ
jgi:hypothetical protein